MRLICYDWLVFAFGPPSSSLASSMDCEPIVALRSGIIVTPVNPSNDGLGGLTVFQCLGQTSDFLGGPSSVAQELFMMMVGIVMEVELIGDGQQCVDVVLGERERESVAYWSPS